jgi:hypothetical protein
VSLAGVDDGDRGIAQSPQQRCTGRHDSPELRHVIAERLAEAARVEKVALHIDDHQGEVGRIDVYCCGLRLDRDCGHDGAPVQALTRQSPCQA